MQYGKPSVSLYLDKRHKLKSGKYSLKLRVDFHVNSKQVQKYYPTGYALTEKQWQQYNDTPVPFALREMRKEVIKFESKANDIIEDDPRITVEMFEALFVGKYAAGSGISILFNEVIHKMESEGRISTASSYRSAMKSLMSFRGDFPLSVVNIAFLKDYERWFLSQEKGKEKKSKKTITSVGFYLRALRAIFSMAIDKRIVSADLYPFGRNGYTIPKGSNVKKALKKEETVKLQKVKVESEAERKALALWMFSYYCNGVNFQDMAYLRHSDIHDEVISFIRRKTIRTVRELKPIVIPLRDEVRVILEEYGNHSPYCFGVIKEDQTPKVKYRKIQDWIKLTNKYVNKVTKRAGIAGKVNTYAARHSFASALIRGNANLKAIQQSLGHRSIVTTESYLADLDMEERKKLAKLL